MFGGKLLTSIEHQKDYGATCECFCVFVYIFVTLIYSYTNNIYVPHFLNLP